MVESGHILLVQHAPERWFGFPAVGDPLGLELEVGEVVAYVGDDPYRLATIERGSFGAGADVAARWVNVDHLKVLDVRPAVMADAVERWAPDAWPPVPLRLHG